MKKFVLDEGNKSGKEFLQPKAKTELPPVVATEITSEKIEGSYRQELMGQFVPKPPMDWRAGLAEFLAKHEALHREALKVFSRQKSPILYNIPFPPFNESSSKRCRALLFLQWNTLS